MALFCLSPTPSLPLTHSVFLDGQNSCSRHPGLHGQTSCSRQSGVLFQSSPAQGRPTTVVSYCTFFLKSDRPPAVSPKFLEWPSKLPCLQFECMVTHVPLRHDPFSYSLLRNIKLNYNIGILCYTLDDMKKYVAHHYVFSYIVRLRPND